MLKWVPSTAIATMFWLGLTAGLTRAAQTGEDLVQAQLICDVAAIQPGATFTVGVKLDIFRGWHIYWHNPGDSGLATKVDFHLSQGLHLVELHWPTPHRFVQPGDIVGYGYEDEVVLLATIQADPDLPVSGDLDITADVGWLVCEDVCLPGKATIGMELPVGPASASAESPIIENWRKRIPVEPDQASIVQSIETTGVVGETVTLTVRWTREVGSVDWFPAESPNLQLRDVRIMTQGRTTTVEFTPRLLSGARMEYSALESVLSFSTSGVPPAEVRGLKIQIPLR